MARTSAETVPAKPVQAECGASLTSEWRPRADVGRKYLERHWKAPSSSFQKSGHSLTQIRRLSVDIGLLPSTWNRSRASCAFVSAPISGLGAVAWRDSIVVRRRRCEVRPRSGACSIVANEQCIAQMATHAKPQSSDEQRRCRCAANTLRLVLDAGGHLRIGAGSNDSQRARRQYPNGEP